MNTFHKARNNSYSSSSSSCWFVQKTSKRRRRRKNKETFNACPKRMFVCPSSAANPGAIGNFVALSNRIMVPSDRCRGHHHSSLFTHEYEENRGESVRANIYLFMMIAFRQWNAFVNIRNVSFTNNVLAWILLRRFGVVHFGWKGQLALESIEWPSHDLMAMALNEEEDQFLQILENVCF